MAPTPDAFDRSSEHRYEALLLQLATLAQRRLDRAEGANRLYPTGVRDPFVNCVALTLAGLGARRGEAVTQRVTEAPRAGTRGQGRLLDTALHAAGQPDPRPSGMTWGGRHAFEVQHGRRGSDEDYGLGWGRSRSTRISWRRRPDCDLGLLYAFDTIWDAYAVLADPVHRDVVREAYAHALTTHPDMDPERFAALVQALPHQPAAPAPPAAATAPATSPALGVGR